MVDGAEVAGEHVLHALRWIEHAAVRSRQRQFWEGQAIVCRLSIEVAIARSLAVAQQVFQATCRGKLPLCLGTRARVTHALMVWDQLVLAREERWPRSHEEALARMAETSLAAKAAYDKKEETSVKEKGYDAAVEESLKQCSWASQLAECDGLL